MTKKIVITTGLALFAMFFGAGNLVYPLMLGATSGSHIMYAMVAFLIAGVGLPFLGLFATSLYQGDYWKFFSRLGKTPSFLIITFLIFIIGPLFAIPRTESVTYHSLEPFLPSILGNPYFFSGLYCVILFVLTHRQTKIIDIIGYFLSPVKLAAFILLIVMGLASSHPIEVNHNPVFTSLREGFFDGYGTMDLLGAIFFCTVIYQSILSKAKTAGIVDYTAIVKLFFQSCLVGGFLLAMVYIGFMWVAVGHAAELKGVQTAQMIQAISTVVFGRFGSLFVGVCVSFACIATAAALTEVTTHFFHEHIFKRKIGRTFCLVGTLTMAFAMSIMGFSGIMKIALPILIVLYPALIIYSIVNIIITFIQYTPLIQQDPMASK